MLTPPRSPVEPGSILDLGAGNGAWVQEVAVMKPDCKVIGTDVYYFEPPDNPNQAEFEVGDSELEFAKRVEAVTLVNLRDSFLWAGSLEVLIMQIHGILGPNGCFQSQELRLSAWSIDKPQVGK
jgi:SAM-dependent methyltransferase